MPSELLETKAQELLGYVETLTTTGDELMFTMDVPYVPALEVPIVLAQATDNTSALQADYQLTVCKETESTGDPRSALRTVDPATMLAIYLQNRDHRAIDLVTRATIKPTILAAPVHGKLTSGIADGLTFYAYSAEPNYVGNDKAVFMAEFEGKRYKIVVNLVVSLTVGETPLMSSEKPVCPPWKLIKVNNKAVSDASPYHLNSFTITFGDLAGSSVGQTTGEGASAQITLDTAAAGHGWYIGSIPATAGTFDPFNTDDYLPTSNPNLWQAKADSAADGKMDMLSVLLHEYGHALGLEHSADSADFMSATLQSGQRRLPSADELTLMSQLVAQLKASTTGADGSAPINSNPGAPGTPSAPLNPNAPLGALLIGRLALGRRPEDEGTNFLGTSQALSQALFSANPTLQGGNLSTLQDWATQGNVVTAPANTGSASTPAGATLAESSTSQTRLNQVFMVGPKDRYLSFTLSNLALDDATAGPDDAFEAALINANTGANLLGQGGGIGLSQSDAMLNLQAAGGAGGSTGGLAANLLERAAQGVTHVTHPDGSRTYLVDLTGIARDADGTVAVNLSFDLIGFGNTPASMGSHVQVSNVRLLGLPQAADDSVSTAEDTPVAIN